MHLTLQKKYQILLLTIFSFFLLGIKPAVAQSYQIKKVVIDPGHGGKDPGSMGTGKYKTTESDIALLISLKLRDYIKEYMPEVEVIMTREDDTFIELNKRAQIANEAKADLFISIHCNSNNSPKAFGTETYTIGMHKNQSNLDVAKRENSVIYLEEDYEVNYSNYNPNSPESIIAISMMQQEFQSQSIYFASLVQDQFRERVSRKDRGVKQAGYVVISKTVMPSCLVELGFISNASEEDFLNSEDGQAYMASAIYRAFKEYKQNLEIVNENIVLPQETAVNVEETSSVEIAEIEFKVQFATSSKKIATKPENFKGLKGVEVIEYNGVYRYVVGNEYTIKDATELQTEVRKKGYPDAFVIAYLNGERITVKEAIELLK